MLFAAGFVLGIATVDAAIGGLFGFVGFAMIRALAGSLAITNLVLVAWVVLGVVYVAIGAFYVLGKASFLMRTLGPPLSRLSGGRGAVSLGVLFGLNIPACAAPLIFALFGTAAAAGAAGRPIATGFVSLGLFGLALSLPLVLATAFSPARRALDWLASLSRRIPFWTGVVLIVLGLWSIGFGLFVSLENWT